MKRKLWAILSELLVASMLVVNMPTISLAEQYYCVDSSETGTDVEVKTDEENGIDEETDVAEETVVGEGNDENADVDDEMDIDGETKNGEEADVDENNNVDDETNVEEENEEVTDEDADEETEESEEVKDLENSEETEVEDLKTGNSSFTLTLNGELNEEYTDIIEAVASLNAEDEAIIRLTDNIVLPDKEPIVISAGKLTLDLNGYTLSGEGYTNTNAGSYSQKTASIIYIDRSNVTLVITGNGMIEGRNITGDYFFSYAVYTEDYLENVAIIHENGLISGNGGIRLYGGSLESHGSYEVDICAIRVDNGDVQIDGADITVEPRENTAAVFSSNIEGIYCSPQIGGKQSNIKNTKINIENKLSKIGDDYDYDVWGIRVDTQHKQQDICASPNFENVVISVTIHGSAGNHYGISSYAASTSKMKNVAVNITHNGDKNDWAPITGISVGMVPKSTFESDNVDITICGTRVTGYQVSYIKIYEDGECNVDIHDSDIDILCNGDSEYNYGVNGFGDFNNCNIYLHGSLVLCQDLEQIKMGDFSY